MERLAAELEKLILREGPDTHRRLHRRADLCRRRHHRAAAGLFRRIQKVLTKYDILCLGDEIVCGFGRTGNWFGKETVGMTPDMMSLAKGLSSSYFPISAVVVGARDL